jgi:hypothetical protein
MFSEGLSYNQVQPATEVTEEQMVTYSIPIEFRCSVIERIVTGYGAFALNCRGYLPHTSPTTEETDKEG